LESIPYNQERHQQLPVLTAEALISSGSWYLSLQVLPVQSAQMCSKEFHRPSPKLCSFLSFYLSHNQSVSFLAPGTLIRMYMAKSEHFCLSDGVCSGSAKDGYWENPEKGSKEQRVGKSIT